MQQPGARGVHSLGCRLALCHRTSRSRIPSPPPASLLNSGSVTTMLYGLGLVTCLLSYLPHCKVRGMHTLGAPPAEESRDRIQLRFTLGLDIQGRPPPPAPSHSAAKLKNLSPLLPHLATNPPVSPPPSAGNARLLPACSHPGRPLTPLLSLSSGLSPLPSAFPLLPRSRRREALLPWVPRALCLTIHTT